jgi:hypothetical protein
MKQTTFEKVGDEPLNFEIHFEGEEIVKVVAYTEPLELTEESEPPASSSDHDGVSSTPSSDRQQTGEVEPAASAPSPVEFEVGDIVRIKHSDYGDTADVAVGRTSAVMSVSAGGVALWSDRLQFPMYFFFSEVEKVR